VGSVELLKKSIILTLARFVPGAGNPRTGPPNTSNPTKSKSVSVWPVPEPELVGPEPEPEPDETRFRTFSHFYNALFIADFKRMIQKYNVEAFASYSTEVKAMTWDESRQAWKIDVQTPQGMKTDYAHVVINGHGVLNRAKVPMFPDEEKYKGVVMHTSRFDRSVPLAGKKVAVIGNGSSGVGFFAVSVSFLDS
jgi:hypothetical protein